MSQNFNITNFLKNLEQNQPKSNRFRIKQESKIEKIYLSHPDWYGKYQIFPMISTSTGQPFTFMKKTREIKLSRKIVTQAGEEKEFESWIKILPAEAYTMPSPDGQIVSSLTAGDEELLSNVQASFDNLYEELGGTSKERNPELNKTIGYMRRRNYTMFYARCLNHWLENNQRSPKHTNFSALFICSAKGFPEVIQNNINDTVIQYGDPSTWIDKIYNRNLSNREGFLLFSISLGFGSNVGYTLSAQHIINPQLVGNEIIPSDEAELMTDPVEGFLGWQASRKEPGRLFNKELMEETLNTINKQLAAVRATKGVNMDAAANATTETAMASQPQQVPGSIDPMLRSQYEAHNFSNPQAVVDGNTDPYKNPPAAQIDPISQQPINPNSGSAPFVSPAFAQAGNDLPF